MSSFSGYPVENKHLKLRIAQAFSGSWTVNRHIADHKFLTIISAGIYVLVRGGHCAGLFFYIKNISRFIVDMPSKFIIS